MKKMALVDQDGQTVGMKSFFLNLVIAIMLTALIAYALWVLSAIIVAALTEVDYLRVLYFRHLYPVRLSSIAELVWLSLSLVVVSLILLWGLSRKTRKEEDILDDL